MTPDERVDALAEVVRAGLRKCRHEDAPAPLIHEADLTHITHMVTAELATALRDLLAEAWDEGVTCAGRYGHEDTWDWPDDTPHRWNPYRADREVQP